MKYLRLALACTVFWCSPFSAAHAVVLDGTEEFLIRVDDASTTVSALVRVHLEVGDLTLEEGALIGAYAIDVPMFSSKSERGTMRLPFEGSLETFRANGGKLSGTGHSPEKPGEVRKITCGIRPDKDDQDGGILQLRIETGQRILEFVTRYRIVPTPQSVALR